jgi:hypothetical protein
MTKPTPGLGDDWLDEVLGTGDAGDQERRPPPAGESTRASSRTSRSASTSPARPRPAKGRVTAGVDADVLERARNAVWQLAGPPEHLTMAELVEQAIRREVERLEAKHNGGAPFPPRSAQLRPGRPLSR